MKKLLANIKNSVGNGIRKVKAAATNFAVRVMSARANASRVLASNSGENFVESALKILIAVVIGALLLAGLYMLFGDVVMPTLTQKIKDLFNYAG